MSIRINLDVELAKRKLSLTELSERVGVSLTNFSLLALAAFFLRGEHAVEVV